MISFLKYFFVSGGALALGGLWTYLQAAINRDVPDEKAPNSSGHAGSSWRQRLLRYHASSITECIRLGRIHDSHIHARLGYRDTGVFCFF